MSEPHAIEYLPETFERPRRPAPVAGPALQPLEWHERFPRKKAQEPQPSPDDGYKTYLIAAEGSPLVKIGLAKSPTARMAVLQTGQPMTLSLLWTCEGDYERQLHRRFAAQRMRGEWFDLTSLGDPVAVITAALDEVKATEQQ